MSNRKLLIPEWIEGKSYSIDVEGIRREYKDARLERRQFLANAVKVIIDDLDFQVELINDLHTLETLGLVRNTGNVKTRDTIMKYTCAITALSDLWYEMQARLQPTMDDYIYGQQRL